MMNCRGMNPRGPRRPMKPLLSSKLLIEGIPAGISTGELLEFFEEFGIVKAFGKFHARGSRGWVEFSTRRHAEDALQNCYPNELGIELDILPPDDMQSTHSGRQQPNFDLEWGYDDDLDGVENDLPQSITLSTNPQGVRTVSVRRNPPPRRADYGMQYTTPTEEMLIGNAVHNRIFEQQTFPCAVCQVATTYSCSRCGVAFYCSEACQRTDWPSHMEACNKKMPPLNFAGRALMDESRPAPLLPIPRTTPPRPQSGQRNRDGVYPENESRSAPRQGADRAYGPRNGEREFPKNESRPAPREGATHTERNYGPRNGERNDSRPAPREGATHTERNYGPRNGERNDSRTSPRDGANYGARPREYPNVRNGMQQDEKYQNHSSPRNAMPLKSQGMRRNVLEPGIWPPASEANSAVEVKETETSSSSDQQISAKTGSECAENVNTNTAVAAPIASVSSIEQAPSSSGSPASPAVSEAGRVAHSTVTLQNGGKVLLTDIHNDSIHVRPVDGESIALFQNVVVAVATHCETTPPLDREPKRKELVACKFSGDGIYYRAMVEERPRRDVKEYIVRFVDFGNRDRATSSAMKLLPTVIAEKPFLAVKTFMKSLDKPISKKGEEFLTDYLSKEKVLTVEYLSLESGVDLRDESGVTLSEQINKLMLTETASASAASSALPQPQPAPASTATITVPPVLSLPASMSPARALAAAVTPAVAPAPVVAAPAPVVAAPAPVVAAPAPAASRRNLSINDIEPVPLPKDRQFTFIAIGYLEDANTIAGFPSDTPVLLEMNGLSEQMEAHCSQDNEEFTPATGDLCFVKWTDQQWYRAVCQDVEGDSIYVLFLDYGNMFSCSKSSIRRMTEDFVKIPYLASVCALHGVTMTPAIANHIKAMLAPGNVIYPNTKVHSVEHEIVHILIIPDMMAELRAQQLL